VEQWPTNSPQLNLRDLNKQGEAAIYYIITHR